jgi:enoyl-CoA hydratase/carnithine racemase
MEIRLDRHGRHVAIVSIDNQPRLNAMTRQMLSELGALWDQLDRDLTCRCIILTGVGQRAFTVGADISGDLSTGPETARMVNHALLKNEAYSKPIVAAVNGDCVGGGLERLLSADIRAAVTEARFGLPEVKWSIYPFGGSTIKLIQQIGYVHAMDLLLTARLIDAEQGIRLGLVNRLVRHDELMRWAIEMAEGAALQAAQCRRRAARPGSRRHASTGSVRGGEPPAPETLAADRHKAGSLLTLRWRGESRANPSLETPRNSARIRRKRDRLSVADGPIMAFYSRL